MITEIKIRAFRAIEDPDTCLRFISGHRRVLSIYGIENITTNTDDWMYNPAIFVIVVESLDGEKLYGGARVQAANGINPLPIEEATGKMDPKIYEIVKYYSQFGAAELSGLWNSKEVAGFGIGSLFPSRVAVAIAEQIGVKVLFTLCSPTTVRFKSWIGGTEMENIGDKGTFYYPNLDLLATALYTEDAINLPEAHPREREKIFFLRKNLDHIAEEKSPFKNKLVKIHYSLKIASANPNEFKLDVLMPTKPFEIILSNEKSCSLNY
ncbi:hypothetical protein [Segetibacter koreensis]|uniref:hypothetical protein n=1 Tax=Segetibacter koreensis TaxID=398037 RepID=UPI000373AECB|nr:hypothetical protein [Segetibacter koreensis]